MRLAELAAATGVTVPTLKFYLRQGLVPRGNGSRASEYTDEHVRRVRLIRSLADLGGLSLTRIAAVLTSVDAGDPAATAAGTLPLVDDVDLPKDEIAALLDDAGVVGADEAGRRVLARALLDLRRAGHDVDARIFRPHARAAVWLASEERATVGEAADDVATAVITFGAALQALRVAAFADVRRRP